MDWEKSRFMLSKYGVIIYQWDASTISWAGNSHGKGKSSRK